MTDAFSFTKLVPGFEFLQGLAKSAGAALPGMSNLPGIGQWVAPTLNPEEIEKRISELRTVQFWLEQNARMLGATIQALEVQRMTLSTLKTMNVQMGDLRESLTAAAPIFAGAVTGKEAAAPTAEKAMQKPAADVSPPPADVKPPPGVDPMQWWSALTQQFTELASKAVKDNATDAAKRMVGGVAGAMVKQGMNVAEKTMKAAAGMPARAVRSTTARVAKSGAAKSAPRKTAAAKTAAPKTGARRR
jgi:hypothetical protein